MRRLASFQKIKELTPIKGADRIELAHMEDIAWKCVVQKGEVKVGEIVVYFEIDSVLPDHPSYDFLKRQSSDEPLITKTFKGQVSQGLILPVHKLHKDIDEYYKHIKDVGDLSEFLEVKKWEPQLKEGMENIKEARFIPRVSKTSEDRIQSNPKILASIPDNEELFITVKLDGTSATYANIEGQEYYASACYIMEENE